jgi:hypothetical protein
MGIQTVTVIVVMILSRDKCLLCYYINCSRRSREVEAYSGNDLMGGTGGIFGLFLGLSFWSFYTVLKDGIKMMSKAVGEVQ